MATGVGHGRICLASFNGPTPKTPVIRKDRADISYISRVIADFVPNFVAMATGVGPGRIVWHHSIARPRKPPVIRKHRADISHIRRVIADFVQISLPWQRGLVILEFAWHHSIASPRKPPVIRKHRADISHIRRVIADFVPNFVAMATGVGHVRICLASFNSLTPKTHCYTQTSRGYLAYKASYSQFCPKFRCHGNRGWSQ